MTEFEKVAAIPRPVRSRSSSDHYAGRHKRKLLASTKTRSPLEATPPTCSGMSSNVPSVVTPLLSSSSSLTIGDENFHIMRKEMPAEDHFDQFIAVTGNVYKSVPGEKVTEQNQEEKMKENNELELIEKETQDEENELLIKMT
uniref:Uncharacterized protein n=1 Tax=Heterorhabditis bacteriophora TaxID=37862 RepID=A0A1I7XD84_HETBA